MKDKIFNILVTGVGAIIGYGIINSLRKSAYPVKIFAMDIYDDAYGGTLADKFIKAERADSPNFVNFLNEIIKKYAIDLIITGIEQDLYKIFENRSLINTKCVLNNQLCTDLSKSKLLTFEYLSNFNEIDLIPTLHKADFETCTKLLGSPFLLKPISSYASKGIQTIKDEEDFNYFTKKIAAQCVYQKIVGTLEQEYTISVFGDGEGSFFDYIILKRQLSQEGATSKAVLIEEDKSIFEYITKLCSILKPEGPTNIQLRKENENVFLLEINPRISSACSIRTVLGYNEPEMCIEYYLLNKKPTPRIKKRASAIRYISDFIVIEQ